MKVSSVLTLGAVVSGLLSSFGCAHRLASPSAQISSSRSASVNAPLVAPKNLPETTPAATMAAPLDPSLVTDPPPPPQVEVVGAPPGPDFAWLPGYWEWDGNWTWNPGKWATVPSPQAAWIPGHWSRRDNGWIWVAGYWRMASLK